MSSVHTLPAKTEAQRKERFAFTNEKKKFCFLSTAGLERQAPGGFLRWVGIKMPIRRRRDFGVADAR